MGEGCGCCCGYGEKTVKMAGESAKRKSGVKCACGSGKSAETCCEE